MMFGVTRRMTITLEGSEGINLDDMVADGKNAIGDCFRAGLIFRVFLPVIYVRVCVGSAA